MCSVIICLLCHLWFTSAFSLQLLFSVGMVDVHGAMFLFNKLNKVAYFNAAYYNYESLMI